MQLVRADLKSQSAPGAKNPTPKHKDRQYRNSVMYTPSLLKNDAQRCVCKAPITLTTLALREASFFRSESNSHVTHSIGFTVSSAKELTR